MRIKLILFLSIILVNCSNSNRIVLVGKLGDKFDSKIILNQSGDKFNGYFIYANNEKKKIELRGTLILNSLRLEEFNNNENKLTGIFEGTFDGENYKGYWQDPDFKNRVPFSYNLYGNEEKNSKIKFSTFNQVEDFPFYNGLTAEINGQKYILSENKDYSKECISIFDIRDYNNDGIEDALINHILACGGNCCPSSFFFCSYDKEKNRFIISESFGESWRKPIIEKWKGNWSVLVTANLQGIDITMMSEVTERYLLKNGEPELVESYEKQALEAFLEMKSEAFNDHEKSYGKTLEFDLNGDGLKDKIIGNYWSRWGSINWRIEFSDGKSFQGDAAYKRIGILKSKTKGINDIVCEFDDIYIWNGKKYIKKKKIDASK